MSCMHPDSSARPRSALWKIYDRYFEPPAISETSLHRILGQFGQTREESRHVAVDEHADGFFLPVTIVAGGMSVCVPFGGVKNVYVNPAKLEAAR